MLQCNVQNNQRPSVTGTCALQQLVLQISFRRQQTSAVNTAAQAGIMHMSRSCANKPIIAVSLQAQAELSKLRGELADYAGWSEEEAEQQLQQQCQPVLAARRDAAEQLLSGIQAFLERQTQEWVRLGTMLVQWLLSVAHLNEHHQQQVEEEFVQVQEDVRSEQQRFEAADEAREAALDAAVDLLRMGSSESQLDSRLAAALECLKSIQAGYKEHHTSAVSIMRQYPPAVQLTNMQYAQQLRELLHVGERLAGGVAANEEDALELPSGSAYSMRSSLWAALCELAPKPWLEAFKAQQAAAAAAAAALSTEPSSGAAGLAAESSTATAPAATGKAAAGGKGGAAAAKGKPAANSAAAAAEAEAAAAAAAAKAAADKAARDAAEAAALAAAEAGPPVPCSLDGAALCERFMVPEAPLTTWVQHLQVGASHVRAHGGWCPCTLHTSSHALAAYTPLNLRLLRAGRLLFALQHAQLLPAQAAQQFLGSRCLLCCWQPRVHDSARPMAVDSKHLSCL